MNILIFSPLELPFTRDARFTGLERLCVEFARLLEFQGHKVSLLAHKDTDVPDGVTLLSCDGYEKGHVTHAELRGFQKWQHAFRTFDVIHDIGHLHLCARMLPKLPTVNVLNHAPVHGKYLKAPYNIVSWSRWGVDSFRQVYHQDARYQETLAIDPAIYKPVWDRGDRFLTIGRMHPDKGNLNAIRLCKKLGLPLDVCGGRGSEHRGDPLTEYEQACRDESDGERIRFWGEVDDDTKVRLMQQCRALLYVTDHTEITSHKPVEAAFCGAPLILPNLGGVPEIVTEGVNGYCCRTEGEYVAAIKALDKLEPKKAYRALYQKYCSDNVVRGYVALYEEVAQGLRW